MLWVLFSKRMARVHMGLRAPSERRWPSSGHRGIRSSCSWILATPRLKISVPGTVRVGHTDSLKDRVISVLLHTLSHPHTQHNTHTDHCHPLTPNSLSSSLFHVFSQGYEGPSCVRAILQLLGSSTRDGTETGQSGRRDLTEVLVVPSFKSPRL